MAVEEAEGVKVARAIRIIYSKSIFEGKAPLTDSVENIILEHLSAIDLM